MAQPEQLGRYTLLERIGLGGMAEVWLARASGHGGFAKGCVVKTVKPGVDLERFSRMFMDEARLAALLNHPNIVQIFDFGEHEGRLFIAMEFIQGRTLRALLRRLDGRGVRIPLDHACRIMGGVLSGLDHAHTLKDNNGEPLKIIHRDVSPENVMLSYAGLPKLVDFGIAKATLSTDRTRDGRAKGKLTFMAPEQLLGSPLDHRVDIYACGVMLYELMTGRHPFPIPKPEALARAIVEAPPPHPHSIDDSLPEELCDIVLKALAKDPAARFANAREMQLEIENFMQTLTVNTTGQRFDGFIQAILAEDMEEDAARARRASAPTTSFAGAVPPPSSSASSTLPAAAVPAQSAPPAPAANAGSAVADLLGTDEGDTVREVSPLRSGSAAVALPPLASPALPPTDEVSAFPARPPETPLDTAAAPPPPLPPGQVLLDTGERRALDAVFSDTGPGRSAEPVRSVTLEKTPALPQGLMPMPPNTGAANEFANTTGVTGPVLRGKLWYVPRRVALTALVTLAVVCSALSGATFFVLGVQSGRNAASDAASTLSVTADPGCTLTLDGAEKGTTPLGVLEVTPGQHDVVLLCDDTRLEESVHFPAGREVVMAVPSPTRARARRGKQADEGYLQVLVSRVATLHLDGKNLGAVPEGPLAVPPGVHDVRVVTRDRRERRLKVDVQRGKTATARFP